MRNRHNIILYQVGTYIVRKQDAHASSVRCAYVVAELRNISVP